MLHRLVLLVKSRKIAKTAALSPEVHRPVLLGVRDDPRPERERLHRRPRRRVPRLLALRREHRRRRDLHRGVFFAKNTRSFCAWIPVLLAVRFSILEVPYSGARVYLAGVCVFRAV